MELRLEGEGSVGTLLLQAALVCSPASPPVRPGLSVTLGDANDSGANHRNWILLSPEQAKKLADYLHTLYP